MLYEDETNTRERLLELRKSNVCSICRGVLDVFLDMDNAKAFLACRDWHRTHHDGGIEREASEYEKKGMEALNIATRREIMEKDYGKETGTKLMRYSGVVSLTKDEATEILQTVWPKAPQVEVYKAAMLCKEYGLNPLMKHVFLVPFNEGKQSETWVAMLGIKATRLIASRQGAYSYVDDSPRVMSEAEQLKIFGEVDSGFIRAITVLRSMSGTEARGYGNWPKDQVPYGSDKGNTKYNMAFIRSERNALDRLFPGAMPAGVQVVDESYIEGEVLEGVPLDEPEPEDVAESGDPSEAGQYEPEEEEGGGGETISAITKGEENKKNREASAARRTSDQITEEDVPDGFALEKVANEVWGLQPAKLWPDLNYKSVRNFEDAGVEKAWDCFLKLKSVRG